MKRTMAQARLNATLDGVNAMLLEVPASELGSPAARAKEAGFVLRVLRRAVASVEPIAPVRSDSLQRIKIVRDFVRRHPEHRPEFSMVFGASESEKKGIDAAWAKIQKLRKAKRQRKK